MTRKRIEAAKRTSVGNVTAMTDDLGFTTFYSYDDLNRRVSSLDPRQGQTGFSYDAVGNLLSLTDPVGNSTVWEYDRLNRSVRETILLEDPSSAGDLKPYARLFGYDAVGNLTEKTDRNGRRIVYDYDHLYRNTSEQWFEGQTQVEYYTFYFDLAGQLTELRQTDYDFEYFYEYDKQGRLLTEDLNVIGGASADLEHTYDELGRRKTVAVEFNSTDDLKNTYTYNALGWMTQVLQEGQGGGNVVADKRVDFTYTALGQFDEIQRYADLAGTDLVVDTDYGYDSLARLADREVYDFIGSLLPYVPRISIRHYLKGRTLRHAGMRDWKETVLRMLLPNTPLACVVRLQLDRSFEREKDRVAQFISETGKSRPTYFRLKQRVNSHAQAMAARSSHRKTPS